MITFTKDNKAIILLNDEVTVENSLEVTEFIYGVSFMDEIDEIVVKINSPGGSVMGGYNIFYALIESDKRVKTQIVGIAASIAGIIYMAGQDREMVKYGLFMIHDPFGSSNEESLSKIKGSLMNILGEDNFNNLSMMMEKETWFTSDEMQNLGLVNTIYEIKEGEMKENKITNKAMELFDVVNSMLKNETEMEQEDLKNESVEAEALESKVEVQEDASEEIEIEANSEEVEAVEEVASEEAIEAEVEAEVEEEVVSEEVEEETEIEEEVIAEETEEEVVAEEVEEVVNSVEEMENVVDLTNQISDFKNIISDLRKENEELKNSLTIYKKKEEDEAKIEVLNNAGISEDSFEKWLKLDIEVIKDLIPTVNKKSPVVSVTTKVTEMTVEDKKNLLRNDPEEYSRLIRQGIIK
jgi:ATP-dependent protease ClpP protease subunit